MESELITRRRALQLLGASALAPLLPGCAHVPAGSIGGGAPGKLVTVSLTFGGAIQQSAVLGVNAYYFTLFNFTTGSTDVGPVPAITAPYPLNGFATASGTTDLAGDNPAQGFVGFVLYSPLITGTTSGYQLYTVPGDSSRPDGLYDVNKLSLGGFTPNGDPNTAAALTSGATQLYFQLNLSRLPPYNGVGVNNSPQYLQINFMATDNLPQDSTGNQDWDALGYGPSNTGFLRLNITQNATYSNSNYGGLSAPHEESGDVYNRQSGPENSSSFGFLDITDWTVTISSA